MVTFNLDAMFEDELRALARHYRTLALYATQKAQAMHWRKRGKIKHAQLSENLCDRLYADLPASMR